MSLQGKIAVVTGGGRGIGASVAHGLAAAGASLVVCARTEEQVERTASDLRSSGHEARAVVCDVTDSDSVGAMARAALEPRGRVDILVNNAGTGSSAPLAKITLDDWNRMFAVNATGTLLCTQAFVPGMVEGGFGRVINIASVAARTGGRYIAAYAAAKHAVLGFTKCVAAEVAGAGVTANAVCPGYVDTDMTRDTVRRITERTGLSEREALYSLLETTPQRRLIEPAEVAHVVLGLCADEARSINGQAIVMDGGELLA